MKNNTIRILLAVAGAVVLFAAGFLLGGQRSVSDPAPVKVSETDVKDPFDGLVQTVEGTTPQMLHAEYWTEKTSDEVLFTSEQISDFNKNNPLFVLYYSNTQNVSKKLFMYDLPESLTGEAITALIEPQLLSKMQADGLVAFVNGKAPDDAYLDALDANRALDAVAADVSPRYAICLRRVVSMRLPTDDFAAGDPDEQYCNEFISAEIPPFSGVAVLHESADKQWYYVLYESFCGWVHKDALALCTDREQWLSACRPEQFLIVTGSELVLDETVEPSPSSGMVLPMGTKMKLSSVPQPVKGRAPLGCYTVELPCANADGSLGWEPVLVPVSKDVHVGYLSMTSDSVIEQAFKLLGRVYGWGGSLSSNDCSGIVCQIYGCYGFELPRNAFSVAKLSDLGRSNCIEMTPARKTEILRKLPPGTLLYFEGHIMIYLGMDGDTPYVISSCGKYVNPGNDAIEIQDAYCVMVSGLNLRRASGKTWLDELYYFQWKDY